MLHSPVKGVLVKKYLKGISDAFMMSLRDFILDVSRNYVADIVDDELVLVEVDDEG